MRSEGQVKRRSIDLFSSLAMPALILCFALATLVVLYQCRPELIRSLDVPLRALGGGIVTTFQDQCANECGPLRPCHPRALPPDPAPLIAAREIVMNTALARRLALGDRVTWDRVTWVSKDGYQPAGLGSDQPHHCP
jgi:hypothetical protein